MFNLKLLFFTVLLIRSIAFGEELSYRYHYIDGKECEIKNGQLIDNGVTRDLTLHEIRKLKKYERDLIRYNEFRFNQPLRNMEDLFNYRFGLDKPQIPCFCSFCAESSDGIREQVTRIDFEKPDYKRRLGQTEYEGLFPTPGSLGVSDNNNDYEDNDITKVFDLRFPTANDVCIVEDDVIIDGGKRREYTDEDRNKIKKYDEEVFHMIDELKERLMKQFDAQIFKPDFHENIIHMIKDHSKNMPEFPCICDSCKQDDEEDNKVEPTDKPLPMTSTSKTSETEDKSEDPKDDISKEKSEEKEEELTEKNESTNNTKELSTKPPREAIIESSKETFL